MLLSANEVYVINKTKNKELVDNYSTVDLQFNLVVRVH